MTDTNRNSGFTLIETVVVMMVAIVMSLIAATSFTQWMENSRFRGAVTTLYGKFQFAKMEAIKRFKPVGLEFDYTGNGSYVVFIDDNENGAYDAGEEFGTVTLGDKAEQTQGISIIDDGPTSDSLNTIIFDTRGIPSVSGYVKVASDGGRENSVVLKAVGNLKIQ